jgi:hypothetical protein
VEVLNREISVAAAGAAVGFGTLAIDDFPAGQVHISGIIARLGFARKDTNISSLVWEGDWSLGSTPTADVTLAGTDVDIIASQAIGPAVAGVIAAPAAGVRILAPAISRLWAAGEELNLNLLVDAAHIVDGSTAKVNVFGAIDFMLGFLP